MTPLIANKQRRQDCTSDIPTPNWFDLMQPDTHSAAKLKIVVSFLLHDCSVDILSIHATRR